MPFFRKKPVQIEAHQVPLKPEDEASWGDLSDVAEWCGGRIVNDAVDGRCVMVPTGSGEAKARAGNWIIKGAMLQFYVCRPDVFAQTYERVEADSALPR